MSELDLDEACLGNNMPKFILHLMVVNRLLHGLNKSSHLKVMIKVRSRDVYKRQVSGKQMLLFMID